MTTQSVAAPHAASRLVRISGPPMPYDPAYRLLGRLDKVRRQILRERPDVLEAHSPYLATAAVLASGPRAARVRTAFWHSDHLGVYVEPALAKLFGASRGRRLATPLWQGVRLLLQPFDTVFVAGRQQADRLRSAGVKHITYVPFGVDVWTFRPDARDLDERRRWLGDSPAGAALLVGVGRLAIEKRWDVVLRAFERLRAAMPAVLVILGEGPERARLEASAPPGVTFAGFVGDRAALARILASADALVHGCPVETFGLGVAEAVACGLPVVVPNAGGAAESVDPASSETYASLDPVACAAALKRVLFRQADERRAAALAAAARVPTAEQHFAHVATRYEELLRERPVR